MLGDITPEIIENYRHLKVCETVCLSVDVMIEALRDVLARALKAESECEYWRLVAMDLEGTITKPLTYEQALCEAEKMLKGGE